jgi:hypothetical protein
LDGARRPLSGDVLEFCFVPRLPGAEQGSPHGNGLATNGPLGESLRPSIVGRIVDAGLHYFAIQFVSLLEAIDDLNQDRISVWVNVDSLN